MEILKKGSKTGRLRLWMQFRESGDKVQNRFLQRQKWKWNIFKMNPVLVHGQVLYRNVKKVQVKMSSRIRKWNEYLKACLIFSTFVDLPFFRFKRYTAILVRLNRVILIQRITHIYGSKIKYPQDNPFLSLVVP